MRFFKENEYLTFSKATSMLQPYIPANYLCNPNR
jgi:hypothetical protein